MAKALLGFATGSDPRATRQLASDNRVLRQRVSDLESVIIRLQAENDALARLATEAVGEAAVRADSLAHS